MFIAAAAAKEREARADAEARASDAEARASAAEHALRAARDGQAAAVAAVWCPVLVQNFTLVYWDPTRCLVGVHSLTIILINHFHNTGGTR
jgi:hypothetical protein